MDLAHNAERLYQKGIQSCERRAGRVPPPQPPAFPALENRSDTATAISWTPFFFRVCSEIFAFHHDIIVFVVAPQWIYGGTSLGSQNYFPFDRHRL